MKRIMLMTALAVSMATADRSQAQMYTWHQSPINGHWYAQTAPLSWTEAETQAAWFGGHLATIRDAGEQAWIEATFAGTDLWIGFTDEAIEGQWTWTSGEPVTYTNWDSGQPDNHQGNQDHCRIVGNRNGKWDDHFEWIATPGLIEVTHVLQDDFDDNVIDPLKWNVVTAGIPQGGAAVLEQNQRMELIGRGHLVTVQDFDTNVHGGLRVTGKWTVAQVAGDFDFIQILTRSDGQPQGSYGETSNGLEFVTGTRSSSIGIGVRGSQITVGQPASGGLITFQQGQTYEFEVVDTPTLASFSMWGPSRQQMAWCVVPILSDSTTQKKVVFHNRENTFGRPNIAYLDDVSIIAGAHLVPFGQGCPGSSGVPMVSGLRPPRLGEAFSLTVQSTPPSAFSVLLLGFSRTIRWPFSLPLDLTGGGMPGCTLYVSDEFAFWLVTNSVGSLTWPDPLGPPLILPNDAALLGGSVFFQAFVRDPAVNPAGFTVTNALHAIIGP